MALVVFINNSSNYKKHKNGTIMASYKLVCLFNHMKTVSIFTILFTTAISNYIGQDDWTIYQKKDTAKTVEINEGNHKADSILSSYKKDTLMNIKKGYPYISKKGHLIIKCDYRLDSLNKFLAKHGDYKGYTIQILVSQDTKTVRECRKKFITQFPNELLYDEYIAPNIYLYAGKYNSINDAIFLKNSIEEYFLNTMVVPKSFPITISKKK